MDHNVDPETTEEENVIYSSEELENIALMNEAERSCNENYKGI